MYVNLHGFHTECPALSDFLRRGEVIVNANPRSDINVLVAGTSITFQCNKGYVLSSHNSEYLCQDDGTWNNEDLTPECLRGKIILKKYFKVITAKNANTILNPKILIIFLFK